MNVRTPRIALVAAATVAAAAAASAAMTGGAAGWLDSVDGRGEMLDPQALVGTQLPSSASAEPVWLRAQRLRSEALDRGQRVGAMDAAEPVWLRAQRLRSEALDRRYGLDR
jgi:hypothetical protein